MKHLSVRLAISTGFLSICGLASLCGGLVQAADGRSGEKVGYNQYIRPILSENCFYCHGPDKKHREAELRLDDRDTAVAKGTIEPGNPDQSELVNRITSKSSDERMPPPRTHKTLTDRQKQLLKAWIAQGATYEPHWAYIAPVRPAMPAVKNSRWVQNPVDAFILGKLEANHLAPAKEADPRTLLRRLSLDLTGLPPTREEMDAFLADHSAGAYEKQVDRLLASPHYGERMAVPWLDAVRFADTVGFHGDQNQNVFPYRDYVIDAFTKNKPFDQFTIEQLAGDLLPNPTAEQLTATCFNRLNMMTREGGAQPKEYIAKYQADRVRTVAGAWLGSTMGCCECHDHKYDPFKTKDFYALSAYWADVKQWGVYSDYGYSPNPDLRGFNNDYPFPPEAKVPNAYLQKRMAKLAGEIDEVALEASARLCQDSKEKAAFEDWNARTKAFLKRNPSGWNTLTLASASSSAPRVVMKGKKKSPPAKGDKVAAAPDKKRPEAKPSPGEAATLSVVPGKAPQAAGVPKGTPAEAALAKTLADRSLLLSGKGGETDRMVFTLDAGTIAAIRLEALPSAPHAGRILRGSVERAVVNLSAEVDGGAGWATKLAFSYADADFKDDHYRDGRAVLGLAGGWITNSQRVNSAQQAVWTLDKPIAVRDGDKLVVTLAANMLGCVRISVSPLVSLKAVDPNFGAEFADAPPAPAGSAGRRPSTAMQTSISSANAAKIDSRVARTYLMSTGWDAAALAKVRKIHRQYMECTEGITPVLITQSWPPRVTRVLPRGNWQDDSGEIVEPRPPAFLPQPAGLGGKRQTRLDLAHWLVAPENPLTSRAVVNRLWKQFFGNGLSGIVEDLGAQGEWPSHPELLDWLAVEFRTSGWDVRHMVRLMVTSAAYRQDSNLRSNLPALRDLDPANRLLTSQNPRRLDAEFVRDNALAIAGLINLEIGGPSRHPYQPAGYYANIQFPDRQYVADVDDEQYRRGLYMHWQRTFLHPMLANFDATSREDCACTRVVSNTPQQALTLLNDPEFVEAAKALAALAIGHEKTDDSRLEFIYRRALARSIRPKEAESLKQFLAGQRSNFKAHPADAGKLLKVGLTQVPATADPVEEAAWTNVCRVVLNLHETITRY
jgi:hypothetical protein